MKSNEAIEKIKAMLGFRRSKFASTFLEDGTTEITNNLDSDFEIGQVVYVVGESTLTPAPEGEHKTREGWIVTLDSESVIIAITSGETEEDMETEDEEKVEEVVEDVVEDVATDSPEITEEIKEEIISELVEALAPIIDEIKELDEELKKMKKKMEAEMSALKSDFDKFKKSPEKFSVVEKKTYKENFDDYKLDLIKSLRR
jgi:ribosomal protein L21E